MSANTIDFLKLFHLRGPLVLAPMAGGPGSVELAATVCNAGALGSLGGAYLSAAKLEDEILNLRKKTIRPFAVNLFVPTKDPLVTAEQLQKAIRATATYRQELGLSDKELKPPFSENFEAQLDVILKQKPAIFSFVFGVLDTAVMRELKRKGIFTLGTATTLQEAVLLEESGVDALVAQGVEGGGHRGIFDSEQADPEIGVFQLVKDCAKELKVPVIAAGGIMNGAGIRKALLVGAQAAQLGTAFLACEEAGTSKPYRERILDSKPKKTRLTKAFSGRWARGLENRFMLEMENKPEAILPFPAQNVFTRDLRNASTAAGKSDFLSLWAGEGVNDIRMMKAADLVEKLFEEAKV